MENTKEGFEVHVGTNFMGGWPRWPCACAAPAPADAPRASFLSIFPQATSCRPTCCWTCSGTTHPPGRAEACLGGEGRTQACDGAGMRATSAALWGWQAGPVSCSYLRAGRIVFMSSPQEARSPGIPWEDLM